MNNTKSWTWQFLRKEITNLACRIVPIVPIWVAMTWEVFHTLDILSQRHADIIHQNKVEASYLQENDHHNCKWLYLFCSPARQNLRYQKRKLMTQHLRTDPTWSLVVPIQTKEEMSNSNMSSVYFKLQWMCFKVFQPIVNQETPERANWKTLSHLRHSQTMRSRTNELAMHKLSFQVQSNA